MPIEIIVSSGVISSGLVLSTGTGLFVESGGTSLDSVVSSGGGVFVSGGGAALSTTVSTDGTESVSSGGSSFFATLSGGIQNVNFGGTSISATVQEFQANGSFVEGFQYVSSGGVVSGTIDDSGESEVKSGGRSFATQVLGTGTELVDGGTASGTFVGGEQGTEDVVSGGISEDTVIGGGGEEVVGAGTAISTQVDPSGELAVVSGGTSIDAVVTLGGILVFSGGVASGATGVNNGGLTISTAGIAVSTFLESGASIDVVGVASATTVASAGVATASSGGVISDTVVASGGSDTLGKGGVAFGTVLSGGFEIVSGGTAFGTLVQSGALQMADTVSLARGSAISTVVYGGGTEALANGLSLNTQLESGGFEVVSNGGVASDTTISGGAVLAIESGGTAFGSITFAGSGGSGGSLGIVGSATPAAVLSGFAAGDAIVLSSVAYVSGATATVSGGTLTVAEGGSSYAFQIAGTNGGSSFDVLANTAGGGSVVTEAMPCFAAGTRIQTERGMVPVEQLAEGDRLPTGDGTLQPIIWIGSRHVDIRRHPHPEWVRPVRIAADAFGQGQPGRTLLLSPDHAVFSEGVLIPVRHVVNGTTVAQVDLPELTYFHVELPAHAVILAEGLAVESYLDTGDRLSFVDGDKPIRLHARFGSEGQDVSLLFEALACAPICVTGEEVRRVRARLATEARRLKLAG